MAVDLALSLVVPVCPSADEPPVAVFLRSSGWPEDAGSVMNTALWLQSLDVNSELDFMGLGDIDALPGAVLLAEVARRFLQTLVRASVASILHIVPTLRADCSQDEAMCEFIVNDGIRLVPPAATVRMNRRVTASRLHGDFCVTCELRSSINDVFNQPVLAKDISDDKPTAALVKIRNIVGDIGREAWAKRARTTAILGNCPKTVACMRSGVTHWCSYLEITKGSEAEPFPVDMHDILGWSLAFRCIGTFSNYLGHVRSTSCALGHEPPPIGHPSVRRAMGAIAKRMWHSPRPKYGIQRTLLRNMMDRASCPAHWALWLVSYLWLLRVPSEALPLTVCDGEPPGGSLQAAIWKDGNQICIMLKTRKNLPGGSGVIRRDCSCPGAVKLCPVHKLWEGFLADVPVGARPWAGTSAAMALGWTRRALRELSVQDAGAHGTHAFRRGHARDLLENGSTLAQILRAGQWKSAAFMRYLNVKDIERGADVAHCAFAHAPTSSCVRCSARCSLRYR